MLEAEGVEGAMQALFGQVHTQHRVHAGQVVRYYHDYAHLRK